MVVRLDRAPGVTFPWSPLYANANVMPEPQPRTMLDHALSYARFGFYVFPCHDVVADRCSCGHACSSPGKHPRVAHGLHESTRDEGLIRSWWTNAPNANIAVDCGKSGIVVVDVDVKKGAQGRASIAWVVNRFEGFRLTLASGTPTGGLHYFFVGRTGTDHGKRIGAGVDIQSTGAYVLLPPSVAYSQYDTNKNPVSGTQAPYHWLNNFALQPYPIIEEQQGYDFRPATSSVVESEARAKIPYGEHRNALLRLAFNLRRVLGHDVPTTVGMLKSYIASGTLDNYDSHHPFTDRDLEGMVRALPPNTAPPLESNPSSLFDVLQSGDQILKEQTPERQVIIDNFVLRGEFHVMYGPPGAKKTTMITYLLAMISRLGLDVCVFISEDQPKDFLLKYLAAGGVRERFYHADTSKLRGDFLLPKHKAFLEDMIKRKPWGCIYFDSINDYKDFGSRLHAGDQAREMYKPLQELAQKYNTAIFATLHTNAAGRLEGSVQTIAKARVVARVDPPPDFDLNEEGYDFSGASSMTAIVTVEKYSRGVARKKFNFYFDTFEAINPDTGVPEYEIQENGARAVKELLYCTGYERNETIPTPITGRPRIMEPDLLRERIAGILAATPNRSSRSILEEVRGNREHVFKIVRELKQK
jgi:Bifunctional DNA primase/polymerase, N-terminal/AAA domain